MFFAKHFRNITKMFRKSKKLPQREYFLFTGIITAFFISSDQDISNKT